ncbi:MAG: hypothetical protein ABJE10_06400 [bacterium]
MMCFALASVAAACHGVLDVQSAGVITGNDVATDTTLTRTFANGIVNEFRGQYAWMAHAGASASGEVEFSHAWGPWNEIGERTITADSPVHVFFTYNYSARASGTGIQFVAALRSALGDRAKRDSDFAKALVYDGYSQLQIGLHYCEFPLGGGPPKPASEVLLAAIKLFEEAEYVATNANATAYLTLSRVGLARAYLQLGNKAKVIEYAKQVPATFSASVRYIDDNDMTIYNVYYRVVGLRTRGEFSLAYDADVFKTMRDRRVPFESDSTQLMFDTRATRRGFVPLQPRSFSGWAPGKAAAFTPDASIEFASGLEATYMLAEAGGMSSADLRAFIDGRRAVGGQPAFGGTDAQLFDELLEQRKWDFYLAGFRMGDLIRYKALYGKDLWPKGRIGGFTSSFVKNYGSTECFPMSRTELNGNPNIPWP